MGRVIRRSVLTAIATFALACTRSSDDQVALPAADPERADWASHGRTFDEQRHSPLRHINASNVKELSLAWSLDLGTLRGLEATPLVRDTILYTTSAWNVVYAVNARSGRVLWIHDPKTRKEHARFMCCDAVNRGPALLGDRVYASTLDGRLIALDANTGNLVWQVQTTPGGAYTITGAPRIAKGLVLIGNSGADFGVRGYLSAYDAVTGTLAWRTYFVPGDPSKPFESEALRRAAATWSGEWWKVGGGGTAWDAIVYDPILDLVYVGTGNGSPWYRKLRSKGTGDNLYLSSIVALRADDGEMVWHYQTTPGDSWDFTATQPLMLANLRIGGRYRRVIMQAPKNGFFYVIDRENGLFISAGKYGEVTWASAIDSAGRPIVSDAMANPEAPTVVAPGPWGAHNWYPMSYNPATGLVYFAVQNAPFLHNVDEAWRYNPGWLNVGIDERYVGPEWTEMERIPVTGHLVAWDPVNQREAWRAKHPTFGSGGTLTTAGNLVFQGRADGMLLAYRATDGQPLWEFNTGTGIGAPPITYASDGVQYVAIMAGRGGPDVLQNANTNRGSRVGPGRLLAFRLGGSATLPPFDTVTPPVSMPSFRLPATNPQVAEGAMLYGIWCARCHGLHAASGGIIPDLRYASTATHESFQQIVRGGARMHLGMPQFADELTPEQARLVQAYVLHLARAAARGFERRARR